MVSTQGCPGGYTREYKVYQSEDKRMFLDYLALGILIFVGLTLFYAVIAIHDIPYDIARHRDHPHQDAIHVAGWVSLFTLHLLWPFLWIWAMLYRSDRGWGMTGHVTPDAPPEDPALTRLEQRIADLEKRLPAVNATQPAAMQPTSASKTHAASTTQQPVEQP